MKTLAPAISFLIVVAILIVAQALGIKQFLWGWPVGIVTTGIVYYILKKQ